MQNVRIDGIVWTIINKAQGVRYPHPLCPLHQLRMRPTSNFSGNGWGERCTRLSCEDCQSPYTMPRSFEKERIYVIDRIDAKVYKGMKVLNLDDEAVPVAKAKAKSGDNKYFVTAQLMESKRGIQAVVYAGITGTDSKTQIFIEPDVKRLAFDQKDLNPSDVFLELKGTFRDGSSHAISASDKR